MMTLGFTTADVRSATLVGNSSFAAWLRYFSFDGETGILLLAATCSRLVEDFVRLDNEEPAASGLLFIG